MAPPFPVTAPHRVVPAPRPLGDAPHVVLDDAWPAALGRRLDRLQHDRDGVVVLEPGGPRPGLAEALNRAWSLLPLPRSGDVVHLPHLGAEVDLRARTARATASATADVDPQLLARGQDALLGKEGLDLLLVGWLLACSDDIVVLRRTSSGHTEGTALAAEVLAVCFPSGSPVRERAGAALEALHAPVADGDRLRRATPALSKALLTGGPYVQHVWGLNPTGRLDRDPTAADREPPSCPPPDRWWLRVERQTTVPLGDRALFLIRPYLTPLPSLAPDQQAALAAAVASMSPESRAYKGLTGVADDLVAWLSDR